MSEKNLVDSAIDLALNMAGSVNVGDTPYVVVPEGSEVHNLESMLPVPVRKRGMVQMRDTESFIAYVNQEKTSKTRLYGNTVEPGFTAVINDHGSEPDWRDYRVLFNCPKSVEWKVLSLIHI